MDAIRLNDVQPDVSKRSFPDHSTCGFVGVSVVFYGLSTNRLSVTGDNSSFMSVLASRGIVLTVVNDL